MKKKGFTLIELLAVIVILAIIALIATPLVLKYIEYSKEKSAKISAQTYAEAVEKEYVSKLTTNEKIPNGTYNIEQLDNYGVKVKGDKPEGTSDYVVLNNGNVTEYELTIKGYIITYKDGNITVGTNGSSGSGCVEQLGYTIKFMVDNEPYEIVSIKEGNFVTEPNEPLKSDLALKWWEDEDGEVITFPYTPKGDMIINASFAAKSVSQRVVEHFGYDYKVYKWVILRVIDNKLYIYITSLEPTKSGSSGGFISVGGPMYYNPSHTTTVTDSSSIDSVLNSLFYNEQKLEYFEGSVAGYHNSGINYTNSQNAINSFGSNWILID